MTVTAQEIVRGTFGALNAPLDLAPQRVSFVLELPRAPEPGWRLILDPDNLVLEIYEGNNVQDLAN